MRGFRAVFVPLEVVKEVNDVIVLPMNKFEF